MLKCSGCRKPMYTCRKCGNHGCKSKPGKCPHAAFHPWVDKCLKCGEFEKDLAG